MSSSLLGGSMKKVEILRFYTSSFDSREAAYAETFGEISICGPTCTPARSKRHSCICSIHADGVTKCHHPDGSVNTSFLTWRYNPVISPRILLEMLFISKPMNFKGEIYHAL